MAAGGYDDAATQSPWRMPVALRPIGRRRIDDANRQFEANREAIEANGRRIDERFDALQALILEALEARRAQAD